MPGLYLLALLVSFAGMLTLDARYRLALWAAPVPSGLAILLGTVFFVALVVSVIASLAIDVVVMLRMRVPHVGDVSLPTLADIIDEARRPSAPAPEGATTPEEGARPIRSDQADENPPRG